MWRTVPGRVQTQIFWRRDRSHRSSTGTRTRPPRGRARVTRTARGNRRTTPRSDRDATVPPR
ncbi:MAG: hypothetical protein E6K56_04890 [Ignavibacteria bacterium]|nr:MAG: hypothetical protein E6K56_04890 [Ignavibacteria bacterium]